ncbi:outer membrane homotrimeric porin [Mailhella sp.]|uniref:outer membrane homotrimeric porin n=1 Tax=Mailhella sp. TaxID=1981029 RepID=UPI004064C436
MKKLATLLLAAGMVVAASAPANAVDVKVDARYRTTFSTYQGFDGANSENNLHRMRLGLTMAASENLSAYVQFQINQGNQWGSVDKHGRWQENDITARMLYLDWKIPGTPVKVRMGRHDLGLPADAFGNNSVLGAGYGNREGIVLTAPVTDWLGLTAIWTRLGVDVNYSDATHTYKLGNDLDLNNSDDMYAVAANLKFDGISGAVYAAYATLDDNTHYKSYNTFGQNQGTAGNLNGWNGGRPAGAGDAYWLGFTSTISFFDPFVLKLSAAYGEFEGENGAKNANGFNVQAKASYKTAFGTPVLGGWYFSGNDENGKGYMPNAGYFNGTNHVYDGFAALTNPSKTNNDGNWAVQIGIEKVSFVAGLTHDLHVTYMQGTHDNVDANKTVFLTEDDSIVEISLNNVYQIYKNLAARLELAYVINDLDDTGKDERNKGMTEDDWYAGLTFDFRF